MGKFVLIAALCILCASLIKAGLNKEEVIKEFLKSAEECRAKVGASSADFDEMMKRSPASTKEGLCLRSCLMKKYGIMDGNGKFAKSGAMEHVSRYNGEDSAVMKIAGEITDACSDVNVPDDHCDASDVILKCIQEQAKARGVQKLQF